MAVPLRRLICRHEFSWSERRQCERCYRCGATRGAEPVEAVQSTAIEAQLFETGAATASRRDLLLDRLGRMAQGESLSRAETIDALLAMIEDSQSSDPVLVGDVAADYFGRLSRATGQYA